MAVTKLSLYNDALQLRGERRLASDTEDREPRYDLDALYDNGAVDYCLEVVKPRYATELFLGTGAAPAGSSGYDFEVPLPADFIAVFQDIEGKPAVYQDAREESPITRFIRNSSNLLTDFELPYIRYIKEHTDAQLADMPFSFGRVVSAYLASELAWKYDPDSAEDLQTKLEQRIEASREIENSNAPRSRGFAPDTLTDELRYIYNDALQILELDPIVSNTDDSVAKNRISLALQNGLVESVLEDTSWTFGKQSDQLFYNPSINPAWGYQYVYDAPADLHRMNGIWGDEYMRLPIRDYVDQIDPGTGNRQFYCSYQIIYIEYISKTFLTEYTLWPAYFKRLIAARMAVDANIPGGNKQAAVQQYVTRRKEALSTDAINGPPKRIGIGSWSRSRLGAGRHDGRPGGY
ncbi:MAG: hypothetical protein E4H01_13650 [Lysobacterales bacterium]|nr:MAG: hypothetical protein E4H01_13650 [Xanthomonadales bacterium]